MSAPLVAEGDSALVFGWGQPRQQRRALIGFLAASVALHALCFYALQIIYPPTVALLPPPGRVTVIAANTEEGRRLLRWVEAEDPALASTTQLPADGRSPSLPTIQHAPSYLMRQPALRPLAITPSELVIPSSRPPGPIEPSTFPAKKVAGITPTTVRLSQELEALGTMQTPEMKFTFSGHESPRAALFRVAVDKDGAILFCFLENSSGDVALDKQAREYLALSRFPARSLPTVAGSPQAPSAKVTTAAGSTIRNDDFIWGTALINWGNDFVAPSPAPEITPP